MAILADVLGDFDFTTGNILSTVWSLYLWSHIGAPAPRFLTQALCTISNLNVNNRGRQFVSLLDAPVR